MASFANQNQNRVSDSVTNDDYKKATAFLNIAIRYDDGSHEDLNQYLDKSGEWQSVGIRLYEDNPLHSVLIALLDEDPSRAQKLVNKLRITYTKVGEKRPRNRSVSFDDE